MITPEVIETLVARYERAIRVTELQYLPVKVAFLVTFILAAVSLDVVSGVLAGFITWLVLTLIMRPRLVVALSQWRISRIIPTFRRVPRWAIGVCCAVYIWFVTRLPGWEGWSILVLIWVLDAAVAILETRQMTSYVHWKEQIQRHYQQ